MKLCPNCRTRYPDDANFCPQEACATTDGPRRLQPAPDAGKPRYQPLSRIGGSSTGEVWKARDSENGAEVAYKVIAPEVLPTATAQSRAEREFKQLMRVHSPRVATVLDCGRTPEGRLYVAMELCAGEPLDRMLKGGPVPFDKAKAIVGQVGQALLEAQKAGIVHRDVSPKNVLVSAAGEVKVINFPVARPVSDKVSGVPAYVSPEQAQGKPVDQRSNTYSLACIFYQLLTGEPPFQAATAQAVLELHVSSPPLPPSQRRPEANVSPEIDRVILKALDKNSSRRHLTLRLFLTEIEGLTAPTAVAPAAGVTAPGGSREGGFAKTMLFAGGQAEVANLVARAIAARTGATPAHGSPAVTPRAGQAVAAVATAPAPAVAPTPAAGNTLASASGVLDSGTAASAPRRVPPLAAATAAAAASPVREAAGGSGTEKAPGKGAAFRETLWFKKGDVDQMVADHKAKVAGDKAAEVAAATAVTEDVRPLEDRYIDDGTVTTEDRKKFSLRAAGTTGAVPTTQAAPRAEDLSDREVIEEIAGTRRTMILVIAGVVVAALVIVLMLMMSRKPSLPVRPPPPHATGAIDPAPAGPAALPAAKLPSASAAAAKSQRRPSHSQPVKKKSQSSVAALARPRADRGQSG
jgi:Protein kinase domain